MSPEQQKLLNIYFNKMQQKVIFANEIIKDNILNFIESYSSLNLSGLLENNDYKIIYPIRNALDFLATVKVKAKDNYAEKVNEAFEKLSVFDWKASENLIFTNLLLSEGKLPELLAKLAENLAMYPVEEIQVNKDVPLDFYESILAISTTNLTILANANLQGITQQHSSFRFRPKSAINHLPSAGQDVRKQPSPSPQGNNELGSSDSDAGISPQPTAGDQRPVESQTGNGAVTQTGDSTQKPSQSTEGTQGVFWNTGRLNPDDYPNIPLAVVDTANELFELLNEGRKGHEVFTEFMMQALPITYKPTQQKIGEVYVLKALGLEGSLSNILDSNGVAINSPNWKRHYDTINEFEDYKTELMDAYKRQQQETAYLENVRIEEVATQLEKEREAETILNGIYQLATNSTDVNQFLQTIRDADNLKSETGKLVMQQLFQISDADSKEARLEKFNQWFSSYKTESQKEAHNLATQKQEIANNENAEPTLRANPGEVLGTARNESVQPISPQRPTTELRGDTGAAFYGESRTSDNTGTRREPRYRIKLESADTELERFYLASTENAFSVTKKLADNLAALSVLNDLLSSQTAPTQADRAILAGYVGFGGLKDIVLNPDIDGNWGASNQQNREPIRKILAEITQLETHGFSDLLASVKSTILDAFYTSDTIVKSIYNGLETLGFSKGKILEPSAGIGNFVGLMPSAMREHSQITQVEIDTISSLINKYLYSDTKVINKPLQSAGIPNRSYDLVISNIPFGDSKVYDSSFKGTELASFQNRIHNYFIAKAMQSAKEGAIIALVASKRVLDSPGNRSIREYMEQNSTFLGAVRLPHKAFENANTQVNADIIFLQKTAKKLGKEIFPLITSSVRTDSYSPEGTLEAHYHLNEYFVTNPRKILGEVRTGGMYDQNDYKVLGELDEATLTATIQETLAESKELLIPLSYQEEDLTPDVEITHLNEVFAHVKNGSIGLLDEQLFKKDYQGELVEIKSTEPLAKIKDYLALKESLMSLINAEYNGVNGHILEEIRHKTRELHQGFVAKYGVYNVSLKKIAKLDDDYYNVLSLIDSKGKEADILHVPTITPEKKVATATDIQDAITLSLYERNKVDIPYMATLLDKSAEQVIEMSTGLLFYDPRLKDYVHRDEYLSGNVKAKLHTIQAEIEAGNTQYQIHLDELSKVIPKDVPANLIEVSLGARWIPTPHYREFVNHLFQLKSHQEVGIRYDKGLDSYQITGDNANTLTKATYSTKRVKDTDMVEYAFGMESPVIRDKISSDPDKYVVNKEETAFAAEKVALVREKFSEWIWKSPARREELGRLYNDKFNTTVLRKYDGSQLNFEGLNGINFYSHQKDAVWRLLQNNGGIIDHIVGGGKTFIMVGASMKMKQLGIAQKPMIIALKSTVPQIVDAYRQAYPLANILAPNENDFKKENRLALFSKIALNDWDCVIMTHDNFNTIPQSRYYEEQLTRDELTEIENHISDIEADPSIGYQDRKKMIARIQGQKKKVEARLEKLLDRVKDNTLDFQQMGIDHIMVDESQQFKNLTYTSKIRNVAGMSQQEGSKRAFNLLVAIRSLQAKFDGDKGTTFLSGTPISNSLVEMYLLFKYLRPNKMAELGFDTFDQWATNFAVPKTDIEFAITGEFKPKTRFSEFINVPELAILYTEIADIRNDDNLVLDKPQMQGNGYQVKALSMNEIQKDFGQRIIEFAKTKNGHILGIGQLTEGQENAYMLLATNLANKMSIDMRLIDPSHEYDPNGKVGTLVKTVLEMYEKTSEHKGTQLIFSDTGTPKNKASFGTLMLDYLMDEVNVDAEVLKRIFGDFTADAYRFPTEDKLRTKIAEELLMDNGQITDLYELARQSEPFNLYQEIKYRLVESGIPEQEVVFIHDYTTALKKDKLFQQVNAGEIRVVLGSTQKLGTGVNVQERIVALHHLDAPWRPSDMEQRNGRGLRQGNKVVKEFYNNELPVYTYCSELSLDTFKYQLLHTKDFLIKQIKNDSIDPTLRVIREVEGDADGGQNFGEILANLSGNTDILEKIKLEGTINKLEKSKKSFEAEVFDALEKVQRIERALPEFAKNIEESKVELEYAQAIPTIPIEGEFGRVHHKIVFEGVKLNGKIQENRKDFGDELHQMILNKTYLQETNVKVPIAEVFGYPIAAQKVKDPYTNIEFIRLFVEGKTGREYNFNYAVVPGVVVNNLEKALMSFEDKLQQQLRLLQSNQEQLVDYKELSNRTWNKDAELLEVKEKLKEVMARLNSLDTSVDENKALIAAAKQQKALAKNPTQTQSYTIKKDAPLTLKQLKYLWAVNSPDLETSIDTFLTKEAVPREILKENLRSTKAYELEINWHNLPYNELPLATKFKKDVAGMRLYPDFENRSGMDITDRKFIAIKDDFVLVLPPTKSHDYRMVNLPQTLTRQDCETINLKGKHEYYIYPREYAEKFVTKKIDDVLNLTSLLSGKRDEFLEELGDFMTQNRIHVVKNPFSEAELEQMKQAKLSPLFEYSRFSIAEKTLLEQVIKQETFTTKVLASPDSQNRGLALTKLMGDVVHQFRSDHLDFYKKWSNEKEYQQQLVQEAKQLVEEFILENKPLRLKDSGKLQGFTNEEGQPTFKLFPKTEQLSLSEELKKVLSENDLAHLTQTGHLNRVVYLERNGAVKPFYVSLDKEINTVFTLAMDRVRATNAILGVTLTESEKTALMDGKTVLLKGLVNSAASDKPFDALVTIDASKMALDFNKNIGSLSEKQAINSSIQKPSVQKEFVGITANTNEQNMPSQVKTINK